MNDDAKSRDQTIIPIEDCPPHVICLTLTGSVKKKDHVKFLWKPMARSVEEAGWFNLLLHFDPHFKGWEPEAADSSWRSIIKFGKHARKLAYVNPTDKKILQMKLSKALFKGEVRFFNQDDLDQALAWISEV